MPLVGFQDRRGKLHPIHCMERIEGQIRVQDLAARYVPSGTMAELADIAEAHVDSNEEQ